MPDSETMAHLLLPIDEQWLFVPEIPGINWLNEVMPDHPYRREFSTEIGPPIYTDEQLAGVLKDFCGNGGAVTFNIACYADGSAGPATIAQLQRIAQTKK